MPAKRLQAGTVMADSPANRDAPSAHRDLKWRASSFPPPRRRSRFGGGTALQGESAEKRSIHRERWRATFHRRLWGVAVAAIPTLGRDPPCRQLFWKQDAVLLGGICRLSADGRSNPSPSGEGHLNPSLSTKSGEPHMPLHELRKRRFLAPIGVTREKLSIAGLHAFL